MPISDFAGGSLNDVIALDDRVIKRYTGQIDRGHEKLRKEKKWLLTLPESFKEKYPLAFPPVLDFIDEPNNCLTELHIQRVNRTSLSKAILRGKVDSKVASKCIDISLNFLIKKLYNIRTEKISSKRLYSNYHSQRLALARKYLRRVPYLSPLLDAAIIRVNGIDCPSINSFLSWLDTHASDIFISSNLYSIHGNFHPDNILIDFGSKLSFDNITFVDPRGDLVGPPHYDFSKLYITLEAYYDEIHYDYYELTSKKIGRCYEININIEDNHSDEYKECILVANEYLNDYAKLENIDIERFVIEFNAVECIHILSFCFYHAYRIDTSPSRIKAFFAIFALLARRLFNIWENPSEIVMPNDRIYLKE